MNTIDKLCEVMHAPQQTAADNYIRMTEIIEFVEGYFLMNIDDIAGRKKIGKFTLNELKSTLVPKINFYKQFVVNEDGVFVKAS
jgi:hypothetical protein